MFQSSNNPLNFYFIKEHVTISLDCSADFYKLATNDGQHWRNVKSSLNTFVEHSSSLLYREDGASSHNYYSLRRNDKSLQYFLVPENPMDGYR